MCIDYFRCRLRYSSAHPSASRPAFAQHLSKSQLAVVSLDVEKYLAEDARKRQGTRTDLIDDFPEFFPESGEARQQAADLVGTNPHYVTDAKKIAAQAHRACCGYGCRSTGAWCTCGQGRILRVLPESFPGTKAVKLRISHKLENHDFYQNRSRERF